MKNMKKLLALILALTMVFALTACGSEPKGNVTPAADDSAAPEATPAAAATPEPAAPEDNIELGSMVGGTYENDFIGIGCKLDDSWTYYTEEEILALNDLTVSSIDDEDLAEQLSSSDSFYDMVASADEGLTSVNVVIENLGLIYGHTLDSSGYIDIALENLEDQLALMGINVDTCEKVSFDFCGSATDGIYIVGTMTVEGIELEMYQRMACVKAGNYMCCITACTYFEDGTTDILDMFYAA